MEMDVPIHKTLKTHTVKIMTEPFFSQVVPSGFDWRIKIPKSLYKTCSQLTYYLVPKYFHYSKIKPCIN